MADFQAERAAKEGHLEAVGKDGRCSLKSEAKDENKIRVCNAK